MTKMTAGRAVAQVLKSWDVDHLYGITADSINNLVDGFYEERDGLKMIQVRHEETGAIAASADAKLTGKVGVSFGSAGPGATHLFNGLYDAKMDHAPVVALVGQSKTPIMNTNYFQEMDEDPLFVDVTQYHKQATNAAQIPYLVDEAVRFAYQTKGPAVVILPDDLSGQEIDFEPFKTNKIAAAQPAIKAPAESDINQVVKMIKAAQRPILWIGTGTRDARDEVIKVSEQFSLPVVSTAPATGIMPTDHENYMGARGRLGTKPGFEVSQAADLVLFVGTNYPFARFLPKGVKFIQVNNSVADLGKQRDADLAILADSKDFMAALLATGESVAPTKFLKAAQIDMANWRQWLVTRGQDDSEGLLAEGVMDAIGSHVTADAVFGLDVGNNTEWAIRQLPLKQQQKLTMSAWFGTMGYGLPAGLAGQLSYPDKQIWSISGDGGYAMAMQDFLTEVKYQLPVINVVLENKAFGFIQHEKLLAGQEPYGIDLQGAKWAKIAEDMGGIGFEVTDLKSLNTALDQIDELQKKGNTLPIVIDAKIVNDDPIDTHTVPLDPETFDEETRQGYRSQYHLDDEPALREIMNKL